MLPGEELVFIIDLNEVEDDQTTISMDFTLQYGARVWPQGRKVPEVGQWIVVHSDDDDTLYYAKVKEKLSDRDYRVAIRFDSCRRVMNAAWSASACHPRIVTNSNATAARTAA